MLAARRLGHRTEYRRRWRADALSFSGFTLPVSAI
jgi:hypothetical protein